MKHSHSFLIYYVILFFCLFRVRVNYPRVFLFLIGYVLVIDVCTVGCVMLRNYVK